MRNVDLRRTHTHILYKITHKIFISETRVVFGKSSGGVSVSVECEYARVQVWSLDLRRRVRKN